MVALAHLSAGAEGVIYFLAFLVSIIGAIVAWFLTPRAIWATCISVALTLGFFVLMWNAFAAA
jgi:hypothetical protein